ncbi:peptidylprolyl isomerase [aff. Roholtiella sp. LEGE 12411]|uniref:peptidylprolyl isomerase n=1 Tax=aff. Roholtiella sp. LEGE 12411 TaxID=1828822 RepID=UPI001882EE4E|nr:peptidylprolyl isomerase [aff. Roholtiella sp. LEGE 12411]MBE9037076.1 peptidylprolyl isomerase [aff. Roholtiella sp. LEGE 12411]
MTIQNSLEKLTLPEITPARDEDILAYLRHSCKIAEIAAAAERNNLALKLCEQLDIKVTDEELQIAGDAFRQENKLLGASETLAWLAQQRISVEDWSQIIRISLLTQKLKEHLFGAVLDDHYINNRDSYKRVALSQILVRDLTEAMKITKVLRDEKGSFCTLALEYSKGKQSRENGAFVGVRFLTELLPQITNAIADTKVGELVGPIQTQLGYHILRVEKWFPSDLSEVREQILEFLFKNWLEERIASAPDA